MKNIEKHLLVLITSEGLWFTIILYFYATNFLNGQYWNILMLLVYHIAVVVIGDSYKK